MKCLMILKFSSRFRPLNQFESYYIGGLKGENPDNFVVDMQASAIVSADGRGLAFRLPKSRRVGVPPNQARR